jgi:hypothetical protein
MITSIKALEFEGENIKSDTFLKTGVRRHDLGILSVNPESIVLEKEINSVYLQSGPKDTTENKRISLPLPGEIYNWTLPDGKTVMILNKTLR